MFSLQFFSVFFYTPIRSNQIAPNILILKRIVPESCPLYLDTYRTTLDGTDGIIKVKSSEVIIIKPELVWNKHPHTQ